MTPLESLLAERPWGLAFGPPNEPAREKLTHFKFDPATGNEDAANAALAGLWLYHDFFDESHALSDALGTREGYYWHAILHRREPDAGNAGYWFRKVGRHPIFVDLAKQAGWSDWNPFEFISQCEKHRGTGSGDEERLVRLQRVEWRLLFDWCRNQAIPSVS